MEAAGSIEDVISREIIRKLRLAAEAERQEDREIICEEVFIDITGQVDAAARERLNLPPHLPISFYQVLGQHYMQDNMAADTVLYFCKRLWGQPWIAPIFALLLHRWLLLRPEAGGAEQRQKHMNVLMLGSKQLFLGDVQSGIRKFMPLFDFLAHEVALSPNRGPLDGLTVTARTGVLAVVAAYLPYYLGSDSEALKEALADFPSPSHTLEQGGHQAGEAAEFVVAEVTDTITKVRTEEGLVAYLRAIRGLGGAVQLRDLGPIAKLRLQSELYSLTTPGGPYYAPPAVRNVAAEVLDTLFPLGRRSRRLVRFLFRVLHPADWLASAWLLWLVRMWTYLYARLVGTILVAFYRLIMRRRR